MRKGLIYFIVITVLFLVACSQSPVGGVESSIFGEGDIENVKVIADQAKITKECSPNAPTLDTPAKDKILNVISQVEDWYAVKMPDNTIGFIPTNQCKPVVVDGKNDTTAPNNQMMVPASPSPNGGKGGTPTTPAIPTTPSTQNGGAGTNTQPVTPKPEKDANNNALTADEQQMFDLVNQARAQNNVAPLAIDMEVTKVARIKSQDMIDNNYFSHNSPTYGSPFDMLKSFGIKYVAAGENIAGNRSVQAAHDALMNSPGHRKNILNPDYTHIGIGIKDGGPYGKMFTQQFISKPK